MPSLFLHRISVVHVYLYIAATTPDPVGRDPRQNITRGIEIKNKRTVTREEVGGNSGGKGGRVFRNIYKGHMYKTKGVGSGVGSGGGWGWGEWWGENETTVLE